MKSVRFICIDRLADFPKCIEKLHKVILFFTDSNLIFPQMLLRLKTPIITFCYLYYLKF